MRPRHSAIDYTNNIGYNRGNLTVIEADGPVAAAAAVGASVIRQFSDVAINVANQSLSAG